MPTLIEALRDSDKRVQYAAARSLGKLGSDAKAAAQPLVRALKSPSSDVRNAAAVALGEIGAGGAGVSHTLGKLLDDPDDLVRVEGALALWKVGGEPKLLLPVLLNALRDHEAIPEVLRKAQPGTWRAKLIKVAATVTQSCRRIVVALAAQWPFVSLYTAVSRRALLAPSAPP